MTVVFEDSTVDEGVLRPVLPSHARPGPFTGSASRKGWRALILPRGAAGLPLGVSTALLGRLHGSAIRLAFRPRHERAKMKSDQQLKKEVEAELEWDASINAANVGVSVRDGVVTLTGHLDTFTEKRFVERAAQRVAGVRALAVELDVKLAADHVRSDSEIAAAIESAFQWATTVPHEKIKVRVEKGWVTLAGEVEWEFQRRKAEACVRPLVGVAGITNLITLKAQVTPANITHRISDALKRQAEREANAIEVIVKDSTVTLEGTVHSWAERAAVQGASYSAPGISQVINNLNVES